MKRYHLFEFEDYPWFPKIIRDGGTDFLGFILKFLKFYEPAIKILENLVKETGHQEIVDLCSGNGGPISLVKEEIDANLEIRYTLTDKYPNLSSYHHHKTKTGGTINYHSQSLDILTDTIKYPGIRTMFTAIHHFKETDVKTILKNTIKDKTPIAFFDGGDKHMFSILAIFFTHPILFFFVTPFIKPFKWSRLFLTYALPLIPLYAVWDGIVSILRLHTPENLLFLANQVDINKQFSWEAGRIKNRIGFNVAYLIGKPISNQ